MKGWVVKKLGEVSEFTNGGAWKQDEYVESGIPIVRVTDIQNETVILEQCKYLSLESFSKYKKHTLFKGDLVITTVGSHPTQPGSVVGRPGIVPAYVQGALLNQNAVRIAPANDALDKKYLGYLGKSQVFRNYIIGHARGSANQVRMSIELLKEMEVHLPPLPIQRKIAGILSAYDNLIENNKRRIEILEEMARSLYNEWFVNFRFPGHEQVKMVDSELGLIPEYWEVVCLGELASFQTGKLNSNAAKPNGIYPFFTCSQEIFKTDTYSFDTECVLLAGNNANGVFHIKYFKGKFDVYQRTYVIRSLNQRQVTNYYLYFAIKAQLEHLKSISTGAATKFLTITILNNLKITVSTPDIQDKFSQFISVLFSEIELLQIKNANLRRTRDLLLPKLILGEIDVENLAINTGELAA